MSSETRRPHTLPRFLLEGFAYTRSKSEHTAFVGRQDGRVHPDNIRNISVRRDFYGRGDDSAESELAEQENAVAPVLARLRNTAGPVQEAEVAVLASFVATLIARTHHARQGTAESLRSGIRGLADRLESEGLGAWALRRIERDPTLLTSEAKRLLGLSPGEELPPQLAGSLMDHFRQLASRPDSEDQKQLLQTLRTVSDAELSEPRAGSAHRRGIRKLAAQDSRDNRFAGFAWRAETLSGAGYVLGDLGPVGITSAGDFALPFTVGKDIDTVILPISNSTLLVGARGTTLPLPTPEALNERTAELSREFFVSARSSEVERMLALRIGRSSMLLSDDAIREAIDDACEGI